MTSAVQQVHIVRVGPRTGDPAPDVAVAEEPLEIRLGGTSFAVIMRTPGADHALAAGFLLAEQVVTDASEIASIRHCSDEIDGRNPESLVSDPRSPTPEASNVVNVWLSGRAADHAAARLSERRHVTANSSCGVCGRRSIDDLMAAIRPIASSMRVGRDVIGTLPDTLRGAQLVFDVTGGLHAAGLFDAEGRLVALAEDVGRHNAVDKVIGSELLEGRLPLSNRMLFVSGRTSFEIVQKAVVAGVAVVGSVSAPSSLAIDLARQAGLTLLGFVRGASFNIYSGAERVQL
jgi:FdhD protein